jgi:pyruvate/2-oxoglutarate dehydrogenase complex dihydrolipoamide dehydrogenase (E3) component
VDITLTPTTNKQWTGLVEEYMQKSEPIINVHRDDTRPFDAIFIGGGAGGRFGSGYLRAMGGRQLIIDRWPFLGGSCPHQACVPHHLFSEAARELDLMRWFSGKLWFPDATNLRASILQVVELFKAGRGTAHAFMNWQSKEQLDLEYILNASATVIDDHTVEVAGERFQADNLVLGIGAAPLPPDIPGIDLHGVYDYSSFIEELDFEPQRCVMIGGSKTGIEYGSFFQAAGCPTTIVARKPLMRTSSLHHVDEDLRNYVVDGMRKRGMQIIEGHEPVEIRGNSNGHVQAVVIRDMQSGEEQTLPCDFVFLATGERPRSDHFQQVLGVAVGEKGEILVDKHMRTSVPHVYAIGDLIGPPMEMFKARKSGVTAARNIMGEDVELDWTNYPDFLHSTYEISWVGLSEEEARQSYDNVVTIQMPPKGVPPGDIPLPCAEGTMLYAFMFPELSGFLKAVVDGDSRKVLGFHHVGYGAKDAFQYLDYLLRRPQGVTIDEMGSMNELFLNPEHFIQLCRLRAGSPNLRDL